MAKRSVSINTLTPTATADTTNLVDATYPALVQGGSSTQRVDILEIMLGGQATTSAPTFMQLARDSTVGVTNTLGSGQTDAALDASTAALAAAALTGNSNSGTKPQRSATLKLLQLSFNASGGFVRWVAPPQPYGPNIIGSTASLGEVSLSAFTGGTPGAMSATLIYEPY